MKDNLKIRLLKFVAEEAPHMTVKQFNRIYANVARKYRANIKAQMR